LLMAIFPVLISACATGISSQVRQAAEPPVPFETLMRTVDEYQGKTVILGGYVLALEIRGNENLATILETPVANGGRPAAKEASRGVFIVRMAVGEYSGLQTSGQMVTVAGRVLGVSKADPRYCAGGCLEIAAQEIHIWAEEGQLNYQLWPRYPYDSGAGPWKRY